MDISVVMVTYNIKNILELSLEELYRELNGIKNKYQSFLYEVIVVDNGTSDESKKMIKEKYQEVKYISSGGNVGYSKGVNKGIKVSKGRYIVLLQPDAFFIDGSLLKIYEHMDDYKDVSIGLGKVADNFGIIRPSRRKFPTLLDDFFEYSNLSKIYPKNKLFSRSSYVEMDEGEEGICHWGEAVFSIIREEDLFKIGYFDEDYFMFYGDTDLALRFFRRGYLSYYFPDSAVVHLERESFINGGYENEGKREYQLLKYKGRLMYYLKNYGVVKAYTSYFTELNFISFMLLFKKKNEELKERKILLMEAWADIKLRINSYKRERGSK